MVLVEELNLAIDKEIATLSRLLVAGSMEDYPNYKYVVGRISGLEWAKENFHHIIKTRLYQDDF